MQVGAEEVGSEGSCSGSVGDGDGDVDAGEIGEGTLLGDLERAGGSLLPLAAARLAT